MLKINELVNVVKALQIDRDYLYVTIHDILTINIPFYLNIKYAIIIVKYRAHDNVQLK